MSRMGEMGRFGTKNQHFIFTFVHWAFLKIYLIQASKNGEK